MVSEQLEYPYDIVGQLTLLLNALDAILPFAKLGGIETNYFDAYDEWENIVEALFNSFLIDPLENTNHAYGGTVFAKPGYSNDKGYKRTRLQLTIGGGQFFLYDIGLATNGHFKLLMFSTEEQGDKTIAVGVDKLTKNLTAQFVRTTAIEPQFPTTF